MDAEPCAHTFLQRHLLQVAGHGLRHPLGIAAGTVHRLRASGPLSAQQEQLLRRLEGATGRMMRLLDDLLDVRLLEEGAAMPLLPRLCDLRRLCAQAASDAGVLHPECGRRVQVEARGDCHGEWDPDRLLQLLANLLDNALEHSVAGTDVTLRCTGLGDQVTVEVHNWGEPIPVSLLPQLFDPLRRPDDGQDRDGWGLGLFLCQEIVQAHGGTLQVHSSASEGTCFTAVLPRK
jgi:signal transduction histidine kinase